MSGRPTSFGIAETVREVPRTSSGPIPKPVSVARSEGKSSAPAIPRGPRRAAAVAGSVPGARPSPRSMRPG